MANTHHMIAGALVGLIFSGLLMPAGPAQAATDVKVAFVLKTTDPQGKPIEQNRFYFVYRPDNLPKDKPVPMVLVFECRGGDLPAKFFHRKADQAGFVLVSCAIQGNSTGNAVWVNDNPRESGWEDMDYTKAVIDRVSADENCRDAFVCGISKGGHMTCAVACELPTKIKAAADLDEFMGLTTNIPTAPVPMIIFQGTKDGAVPYAMVKDTADAWRAKNKLLDVAPVTTFEPSPLDPGAVTQATWEGPNPVTFVTVVGGTHTWSLPPKETGFDVTDAAWAFFAQFVTPDGPAPKITAGPLDNVQYVGRPASFHVAAVAQLPMTYQWQRNGKDIAGATSSSYTTPPATKDDQGAEYRAIVTTKGGSVTSAAGKLKVVDAPPGPTITKHPQDQAVQAGKPVTFSASAGESKGLRFQWQKNGMDIVGATEASYSVKAATLWDSGATFRCVISDSSGKSTTIPAALTVTPAAGAPEIVTNPARQRLKPGDKSKFSVVAKGATPMTYQWQKCTLTTNYVDIPGATSDVYEPPPATPGDHRTLLRCIVSNAAGAAASAAEMMLVTPAGGAPKPAKSQAPAKPTTSAE